MDSRFVIEGVDAGTPVGEAARRILSAKAEPLFALESAAAGGEDADAVHDMRVASRRLREALRLFAPVYRRKTIATWYALVTDVTRTLGRVRDADVFIETFHRLLRSATDPAERAALAYIVGYRQAERAAHLARMRKRLRALDLASARPRFEGAIARAEGHGRHAAPLGRSRRGGRGGARRLPMYAFIPAALTAEDSTSQHAMRIACKRLRYAVETLAPCFGDDFEDAHAVLVAFQDALGELHDHDVFIAAVEAVRDAGEAGAAGVTRHGLDEVIAGLGRRRAGCSAGSRSWRPPRLPTRCARSCWRRWSQPARDAARHSGILLRCNPSRKESTAWRRWTERCWRR